MLTLDLIDISDKNHKRIFLLSQDLVAALADVLKGLDNLHEKDLVCPEVYKNKHIHVMKI